MRENVFSFCGIGSGWGKVAPPPVSVSHEQKKEETSCCRSKYFAFDGEYFQIIWVFMHIKQGSVNLRGADWWNSFVYSNSCDSPSRQSTCLVSAPASVM